MAHNYHGATLQTGNATHQGQIVFTRAAVTVELNPFIGNGLNVVKGTGATGMAGHLQSLGRSQVRKDFLPQMVSPTFELANLVRDVNFVFFREFPNLGDSSL